MKIHYSNHSAAIYGSLPLPIVILQKKKLHTMEYFAYLLHYFAVSGLIEQPC